MNVIIYDDDFLFRNKLEMLIKEYNVSQSNQNKLFIALNTDSFFQVVNYSKAMRNYPSIFLVDILIKDKDLGLKIMSEIKESNENNLIVFITGYPKKIIYNTFAKMTSLNFIIKTLDSKFTKEFFNTLDEAIELLDSKSFLAFESKGFGYTKIKLSSIIFIESYKSKRGTVIHYISLGHHGMNITSETLVSIELRLNVDTFMKVHRSIIVNTEKIYKVNKKEQIMYFLDTDITCTYSKASENLITIKLGEYIK